MKYILQEPNITQPNSQQEKKKTTSSIINEISPVPKLSDEIKSKTNPENMCTTSLLLNSNQYQQKMDLFISILCSPQKRQRLQQTPHQSKNPHTD